MFIANTGHEANLLDFWSEQLSSKKLELLKRSKGYQFYKLILSQLKEEDFSCLYSSKYSAPNSPVNCLVGALVLKQARNWSDAELELQISFNVEIRVALGISDMESSPFSMRTFYNFNNRLSAHEQSTGENLLEKAFNHLTKQQLVSLGVNASIQRGDSVLLESNIRTYSRLALLVEVLRRLYQMLTSTEQSMYHSIFRPYIKGGEKFVYNVNSADGVSEMERLAGVYYTLYELLKQSYKEHDIFQIFQRVYQEHFKELAKPINQAPDQKGVPDQEKVPIPVVLRPKEELGSHTLQSPDDIDATFRSKRKQGHHGFVAFGAETCHPDNELNLVTVLSVATNNTDDATILADKIDQMVEQTPEIEEAHLDAGFGSEKIDEKAQANGITIIQTAVKGPSAVVPMSIEGDQESGFRITCPNPDQPIIQSTPTKKRNKALFDLAICDNCPLRDICTAYKKRNTKKGFAPFYFSNEAALMQKRHHAIEKIPKERQTLRSGVEGLMGLMHRGEKHTGKLRVKGLFNTKLYVFARGIAINFDRIFSCLFPKTSVFLSFFAFLNLLTLFEPLISTNEYKKYAKK